MTNTELCRIAKHIAEDLPTLFVMGGYGARLSDPMKDFFIRRYPFNALPERTEVIRAADPSTHAFDCVCFLKGILWGFDGRADHPSGGTEYLSNDVPDYSADRLFQECYSRSDCFLELVPGEMLWLKDHCGIYLSDGLAAECTPRWKGGVQITALQHPRRGYMTRRWSMHGFLPYVDYTDSEFR